jgi:hypothetical protein
MAGSCVSHPREIPAPQRRYRQVDAGLEGVCAGGWGGVFCPAASPRGESWGEGPAARDVASFLMRAWVRDACEERLDRSPTSPSSCAHRAGSVSDSLRLARHVSAPATPSRAPTPHPAFSPEGEGEVRYRGEQPKARRSKSEAKPKLRLLLTYPSLRGGEGWTIRPPKAGGDRTPPPFRSGQDALSKSPASPQRTRRWQSHRRAPRRVPFFLVTSSRGPP